MTTRRSFRSPSPGNKKFGVLNFHAGIVLIARDNPQKRVYFDVTSGAEPSKTTPLIIHSSTHQNRCDMELVRVNYSSGVPVEAGLRAVELFTLAFTADNPVYHVFALSGVGANCRSYCRSLIKTLDGVIPAFLHWASLAPRFLAVPSELVDTRRDLTDTACEPPSLSNSLRAIVEVARQADSLRDAYRSFSSRVQREGSVARALAALVAKHVNPRSRRRGPQALKRNGSRKGGGGCRLGGRGTHQHLLGRRLRICS